MKKRIYTTIRYEGKRLEPGTYEFTKEFLDTANPDIFKAPVSNEPVDTSSYESAISELEAKLKVQESTIAKQEKEIESLKTQLAASGGK